MIASAWSQPQGIRSIRSLRIPATAFTDPCTPTAFAMLFALPGGSGVLTLVACADMQDLGYFLIRSVADFLQRTSASWCLTQPDPTGFGWQRYGQQHAGLLAEAAQVINEAAGVLIWATVLVSPSHAILRLPCCPCTLQARPCAAFEACPAAALPMRRTP